MGNNETAPLAGDLADGEEPQARPNRLFLLDRPATQRNVEPTTVLMDSGRVQLDPFDHPIRDHGSDLPVVISTEIKGWEIENYTRRNSAITVYDIIGRFP